MSENIIVDKSFEPDHASVTEHACRPLCAACCIAPSISSAIPGMENGKPANMRCVNLSEDLLCKIFDSPQRPQVCRNFKLDQLICGHNREEAMNIMQKLEG